MEDRFIPLAKRYNTVLSVLINDASAAIPSPTYLEDKTRGRLLHKKNIYILSGLSGAGKNTVGSLLASSGFAKVPNVTTRKKRPNELETDYIFIDEPTFRLWRKNNLFATVKKTNGDWHAFLREHVDLLLHSHTFYYIDKSVSSAIALTQYLPMDRCNFIFLIPPSFEILYERIIERERHEQSLTTEKIFDRFEEEITELEHSAALPYAYIVNDSLTRVHKILC